MGQYYKPVNLDRKEYLYTHDYDNGLKLMEHSYFRNDVVEAVANLLIPGGAWHKARIVWAGDYAEQEPGYAKTPEGYDVNIYSIMNNEGTKITPPATPVSEGYHFLVNHTKKVAIDLRNVRPIPDPNYPDWKIHPLPLLTAEGNGQGGGDFRGNDARVGSWARNSISLEEVVPDGYTLDTTDPTFVE